MSVRRSRPVYRDGTTARAFAGARALTAEAAAAWRDALLRHVSRVPGGTVLDLGSGTGRFAALLAEWLDARVVGVEPSAEMRDVAAREAIHPRVSYVGGEAEALPLRGESVGLAWLWGVFHHVPDRPRCARELRRVLADDGALVVAGPFADRLDGITLFRYFPGALRVARSFPTVEETGEITGRAGFRVDAVDEVTQTTCGGLAELAERTRLRGDSTLIRMEDREFRRCQARLEALAAREETPRPVRDTLPMLVLRPTD